MNGLESGERNIEEGSFIIEAAFEGNYVVVWIPSEHIPECLVGNDHPGQKWPAGGFVVELAQKLVDKLRDIREQTSIMVKKRTKRWGGYLYPFLFPIHRVFWFSIHLSTSRRIAESSRYSF